MNALINQLNELDYPQLYSLLKSLLSDTSRWNNIVQRHFDFLVPSKPAAVLVPLFRSVNQWELLFIRRTENSDVHSGQVAFPGGHIDPTDANPESASLREAKEEIGLDPEKVQVVGRLLPLKTVTNFDIIPIVGLIPHSYPFVPAQKEVSRIFSIPIHWLADENNYEFRTRVLPPPIGDVSTIYYRYYKDELLWGATAQIVHYLLYLLKLNVVINQ